jgi:hypothetical protein
MCVCVCVLGRGRVALRGYECAEEVVRSEVAVCVCTYLLQRVCVLQIIYLLLPMLSHRRHVITFHNDPGL